MDRRRLITAMGASATSLALGGHSSFAEEVEIILKFAADAVDATSRTLRGLIPDGSQANLSPIVAEWQKLTGQKIEVTVVPVDDINTRMTIDGLTGDLNFDFALPATFGVPDLISAGVIQPFDPIRDRLAMPAPQDTGLYSVGDFFGGSRFGFQTDGDVYLMFYRADMMDDPIHSSRFEDQFGRQIELPDSWSELDQQMEFFHRPAEGYFGGALFRVPGYLGWEFFARLFAVQGQIFDADFVPLLANDVGEKVLEEMHRASDFLHPATEHAGLFRNWNLYKSENIYANIGWGGSQKSFNQPDSPIRGKLRHAMLPGQADREMSYFNWGWSYVVPATASSAVSGYLFSRFAVSERISTMAVGEKDGYFDPFHQAHYLDRAVVQAYSKPFLDVHENAMRLARHNFNVPGHGSYMTSLNENLTLAMEGNLSARQALQIIESEWELTTLEIGRDEQARRWHELIQTRQ